MLLYMSVISRAIELGTKESPVVLLRETLRRFNLYGLPSGLLSYWLARFNGKSVIVKKILGSKMALDITQKGIHRELYINGIREAKAVEYFKGILKPTMVVVDIGANIGYYALLEAKHCKKVYAVEPVRKNYEALLRNIQLNGYKNISPFNIAIGDKVGLVQFHLSNTPNWHRVASGRNGGVLLPMKTLDVFLSGEKVNVVRMDVEGYELKVIEGMGKTIERSHPSLFIETHHRLMGEYGDTLEQFYRTLASYGYTLTYSIVGGRLGPIGRVEELVNNPGLYRGLGSWLFLERRK